MAKVICQLCRESDVKNLMIKESKGYYHIDKGCHAAYVTEKEFKRVEREKQKKLAEKIAEVYGLDTIQLIPSQLYLRIEDIRNDSTLFGKLGKNYKKGIPYEGIAYTYEYCKEKIRDAKKNPNLNFKNLLSEMIYGLAIVRNNLADARNDSIRKHNSEKSLARVKDESEVVISTKEVKYVKRIDENDVSDFLD